MLFQHPFAIDLEYHTKIICFSIARVACRQLGYVDGTVNATLTWTLPARRHGPADVICSGNENNFVECRQTTPSFHYCSNDIGFVTCVDCTTCEDIGKTLEAVNRR